MSVHNQLAAPVLIAGAGQAGAQVAQSLRQGGHTGPVTLIGDEAYPPYERPPLSKDYLAGKKTAERLYLRASGYWAERGIALRLGERVAAVDPVRRQVTLASGEPLSYGWLVWASGGRPRRLSCAGASLDGVCHIRSIADIDRLKGEIIKPDRRIIIIGGGYIGLEAAAVLRSLGHRVTVLEQQSRLLARVTSPVISRFFLDLHQRQGVEVQLSTEVAELLGERGRVTGVLLSDGSVLPAELVVVGIGIIPNIEPLAAAHIPCPNGVRVDAYCRTADPHILAIGDCALHPNPFAGAEVRLESVQNAVDQARVAADLIIGQPRAYSALPWFWSDQFDVKLQTVGLAHGYDQCILRGDMKNQAFSVGYFREGRLVAMDSVGRPKDFQQSRALITAGKVLDVEKFADTDVELKSL